MERAGFTRVAVTLGLRLLQQKHLILEFQDEDFNGDEYMAYRLSDKGWEWLLQNQHTLVLKRPVGQPKHHDPSRKGDEDDEVPF
jgi:hypothetical protein